MRYKVPESALLTSAKLKALPSVWGFLLSHYTKTRFNFIYIIYTKNSTMKFIVAFIVVFTFVATYINKRQKRRKRNAVIVNELKAFLSDNSKLSVDDRKRLVFIIHFLTYNPYAKCEYTHE